MDAAPPKASRVHGSVPSDVRARYGTLGRPLLDLSANVSPYGPAQAVRAALCEVSLDCYPDPHCLAARAAVATHYGIEGDSVAIGSGAAELIWAVVRALAGPRLRALQVQPTFGEFGLATAACDVPLRGFPLSPADGFALNLAALSEALTAADAGLCYLCAPNNPTGTACPVAGLIELASRHPDTIFLLDQAYLGFSTRHAELRHMPPANVICLRSLTKEQAIPGVRVGYLLAAPTLVARIEGQRPSWAVNAFAQAVVAPALAAHTHLADVRARMMADRERAQLALRQAGIPTASGDAPFLLATVGDARACCDWLLSECGIAVRDCTSFGLPDRVRLSGVQVGGSERLREGFLRFRERAGLRAIAPK